MRFTRYASPTPPHAWPDRRPLVREVITHCAPDLLGTQEGVYPHLRDLAADLPVLLLGDFNAAAGATRVHTILTGDGVFVDSWDVAGERGGEGMGTFNNFRSIIPDGPRIDWILVRGDMSVRHSLPTGGPVPQRPFPGCRPGAPDVPVNGTTRHGSG